MNPISCIYLITGGAIGTFCRYAMVQMIQRGAQTLFPWGTLCVNLTGSLLIGVIWGVLEPLQSDNPLRLFLIIGLLGGFTTFSSFSMETIVLFKAGEIKNALLYIFSSNIGGIALAYGGYLLASYCKSITN